MDERGGEYHVVGPPGTGKTTYLSRMVDEAATIHGPGSVLVASFTRAAAAELVSRGLPLRREQVGTLHAHCYHALGRPTIAETKLGEWNTSSQRFQLTTTHTGDEEVDGNSLREFATGTRDGDELFSQYQLYRATQRPRELWSRELTSFALAWEGWKREGDLVDFTDMIDRALRDIDVAPGNPSIGFFDEVQDFTALELALVRKWGAQMHYFIMAGDPDQTLYSWKGADPDVFRSQPVDEAHRRILAQSYRVPQAVHGWARSWIQQITAREDAPYHATPAPGELRLAQSLSYDSPQRILDDMQPYLDDGLRIMVLASCSYMLHPLLDALRRAAIPWHNPYRRTNGAWNPFHTGGKGVPTYRRLGAFVRAELWTGGEFALWTELIDANRVLNRGAKIEIANWAADEPITFDALLRWVRREHVDWIVNANLDELQKYLKTAVAERARLPLRILARDGLTDGMERIAHPQIITGTIHSVKGGEADVVYVFPDLSFQGMQQQQIREGRDAVTRLFYVAATRAKQTLVLCSSVGENSIRFF